MLAVGSASARQSDLSYLSGGATITPELTSVDDVMRMQSGGAEHQVVPDRDLRVTMQWLFPDTTKNFDRLPLQYRVSTPAVIIIIFICIRQCP